MYGLRGGGFGDAGATTIPAQGIPLATVSPYAARECGFGQKMVGTGPFTCEFDMGTLLTQAWQIPGVYLTMIAPPHGSSYNPNAYSAIGWGIIAAAGWMLFGRSRGRR
jgi:hypothetical protein